MLRVVGTTEDPAEVAGILATAGLIPVLPMTIRGWEYHDSSMDRSTTQTWHHEGLEQPGCGMYGGRVIFWGWPEGSEFRSCRTQDLLPTEPGDVVLISNRLVEHRMPLKFSPDRRFMRAWIQ